MTKYLLLLLAFVPMGKVTAQTQLVKFNVEQRERQLHRDHIAMGSSVAPNGSSFALTNHGLLRNGQPWFATMGEVHFSRIPREKWDETVLKMKACGIDIVATYVFWNHHEEEEGHFDWSGVRDLRAFLDVCARHNLYVWLRIGPWCHGEARNGGFPDWLLRQTKTRGQYPLFMEHVNRLYHEIGIQVNPYLFKNGGPIIGTQIENEFNFKSKAGLDYMLALKRMAIDAGIDVPYYSATSWPGTNPDQRDFVLMYGAYPDAPWSKGTDRLSPRPEFLFRKLANDASIGADLTGTSKVEANDLFPYLSAELGGGNQVTYHRRPFIDSLDCAALAYTMAGSGANGLGYYMFAGGVNPEGKFTTLEENKQTAYPNDYSIVDYDFQSPLGQAQQTRPVYHHLKQLHYFLNDFGSLLADMYPVFPEKMPANVGDGETPRCAVRANKGSGFVFVSHYQRYGQMNDVPNVQFEIETDSAKLLFPETPFLLKANTLAILPFNLSIEGALLKYATAQPLCVLHDKKMPTYVFASIDGIAPEFVFENATVKLPGKTRGKVSCKKLITLKGLTPGLDCLIQVFTPQGRRFNVLLITSQQALQAVKGTVWGAERLVLSGADVLLSPDNIQLLSKGRSTIGMAVYPSVGKKIANSLGGRTTFGRDGVFDAIAVTYAPVDGRVAIDSVAALNAPDLLADEAFKQVVRHCDLPLTKARLIWSPTATDTCYFRVPLAHAGSKNSKTYLSLLPDDVAEVSLNGTVLFIGGKNNVVTTIDLTTNLSAQSNVLGLKVVNSHATAGFMGALFFVDGDEVSVTPSDSTWLCANQLMHGWDTPDFRPTTWQNAHVNETPKGKESLPWYSASPGAMYGSRFNVLPGCRTYSVETNLPVVPKYLNDLFVETNYCADALAVYQRGKLVNDEFWNGRPWLISLGRLNKGFDVSLTFQFTPVSPASAFFVEDAYRKQVADSKGFRLNSITLVPEYKAVWERKR